MKPSKIFIIGSSPISLITALTYAKKKFDVTIIEKENILGGGWSYQQISNFKNIELGPHYIKDRNDSYKKLQSLDIPLEEVPNKVFWLRNFSEFSNVNVIEGLLPETLIKLTSNAIAFLHIDLNHAEPEVATLKELWPKITDGGIIILDDYAWLGREKQYIAMNKLAKELGFSILTTPTGQGIIIKHN